MILWLSKQLGTILKSMPLHVYNTLTLVAPRISSAHWLHTLFNSGNAIICKHCNEDLFEVILNSCNQKWSDASTNSFGKSLDLYSRLLISPCIWKFIFWQGLRRTLRVKLVKLVNHRVRRQLKATIVAHVGWRSLWSVDNICSQCDSGNMKMINRTRWNCGDCGSHT